jgi:hypothetical protein
MKAQKLGLFMVTVLAASLSVACAASQNSAHVLTNGNGDYVAGIVSSNETAVMLTHGDQRYVVYVPGGQWHLGGYDARSGTVGSSSHVMLGTGYGNPKHDYMALIVEVSNVAGGSLWFKECRNNAWALKNEGSCLRTRPDDTLYTVTRPAQSGYINIVAYGNSRNLVAIVDSISYRTL